MLMIQLKDVFSSVHRTLDYMVIMPLINVVKLAHLKLLGIMTRESAMMFVSLDLMQE